MLLPRFKEGVSVNLISFTGDSIDSIHFGGIIAMLVVFCLFEFGGLERVPCSATLIFFFFLLLDVFSFTG